MVAQSAEFKKAVEDSRSLSQTPTNDELLEVRHHLKPPTTHQPPFTHIRTHIHIIDNPTHHTDLRPLQARQRRDQVRGRSQARHVRPQGKLLPPDRFPKSLERRVRLTGMAHTGQGEVQQVGRVQGLERRRCAEEVRRGGQEACWEVQVDGTGLEEGG